MSWAYRVILQLLGTHNEGVSMSQAAKNAKNPVALVLAERAPKYMPWFKAWRALRDSIKAGRLHSMRGPQWNIGVSFIDDVPPLAGFPSLDITVRLSEIVVALDQSLAVSRVALDLAST
jgi:hypothetical protein